MKRKSFLFVMSISFFFLSACYDKIDCSNPDPKAYTNCVICSFRHNGKSLDYDFEKASKDLELFLVENEYLSGTKRSDYINYIKNENYTEVNLQEISKGGVDGTFLFSPLTYRVFVKCAQINTKENTYLISAIKNDYDKVFHNKEEWIKILSNISEKEFEKPANKLFIHSLIYNRFPNPPDFPHD